MSDEWIAVGVTALTGVAWGYHFVRAALLWREERSVRSLRNAYIATMILVAMVSLVAGSLSRGYPPALEFARFVGFIVRGMLLVGAIVVVISWHVLPEVHRTTTPPPEEAE